MNKFYFFICLLILFSSEVLSSNHISSEIINKKSTKNDVFTIQLMGGLGNQMFLAAGQISYARRFHKDICLKEPFNPAFNVNYRICTPEEIKKAREKPCNFVRFSPAIYNKSDCTTLKGYLQNERFFEDQKDFIKEIFQFKEKLPRQLDALVEEIKNKNSVAVHIRRGDYLYSPNVYPIMSVEYYQQGADYIQSKSADPIHLYIFSDDIKWVRDNFKTTYPFTLIQGNSATQDMQLMSLCKHNIIANSTFSWWGAYLNKNPKKIVVAPDKWNLINKWWGDDIILKNWVVLPSDAK